MTESSEKHPDASGKESFSLVLDGEKAADVRLAEARKEAERICQAAFAEDRRISARADRRLQTLNGAMTAMIEAERARLVAAFEAEQREMSAPPDEKKIAAAATRLARRLVGYSDR